MAVSNMNLIWTLVSQLYEIQALACDGDGGGTENKISQHFFKFFLNFQSYNYKLHNTDYNHVGICKFIHKNARLISIWTYMAHSHGKFTQIPLTKCIF